MKALAAEGRTVFVSSHLMSEMENTADHLLVIGRGRMIADCTVQEFIDQNSELAIRVRTPEAAKLAGLLGTAGANTVSDGDNALLVTGLGMDAIGDVAFDHQIRLHELAPLQASLEEAFMELTKDSVEFHATVPGSRTHTAQEA
jgi:ABC-2 type transport system ATP-binding protein